MAAISVTEACKGLFGLIQEVNEDHAPVEVVSKHGNAVLMSKDDYDALAETAYLLRSPANAKRLLESMERARNGDVTVRDLIEE